MTVEIGTEAAKFSEKEVKMRFTLIAVNPLASYFRINLYLPHREKNVTLTLC
jgi:hypothetical protein